MKIIRTENNRTKKMQKKFFIHFFKAGLFESSATLSYYFLFSVFPLAIFISASFSTLKISHSNIANLVGLIPEEILRLILSYLSEISLGNTFTLIFVGFVLTIYPMGKAIQTLKRKIRASFRADSQNSTIKDWIISFVMVILMMLSLYASLILFVVADAIFRWLSGAYPAISSLFPSFYMLRLLAVIMFLFFLLYGIYKILPGIQLNTNEVLPGTVFALAAWIIMSSLFSFYVNNIASFSTFYGSIGAIIALLSWLFFINLIILIGAHINSFFYLKAKGFYDD